MQNTRNRGWSRASAFAWLALAAVAFPASAQQNLCGCEDDPRSLGAFDAADPATFPPGTTSAYRSRTIPLPPDGVLVFDSFRVRGAASDGSCCVTVSFAGNAANTPVTLLVAGDFTVEASSAIAVSGENGRAGNGGAAGIGGRGGPGAFRGGDAAYLLGNQAAEGGEGFGPGGGAAGTAVPLAGGGGGRLVATPELRPLVGGSGGGGGSSGNVAASCAGGGGGGGGGALVVVANGTILVGSSSAIFADGGAGGGPADGSCARGGGGGSGGALRLVAPSIQTGGTNGAVYARGGSPNGVPGTIRFETPQDGFRVDGTNPVALRVLVPGRIVDPIAPVVSITSLNGVAVPQPPQGSVGGIDVFLPAPGVVAVDLATQDVPGGTEVAVRAKPRIGGAALEDSATLASCDGSGACTATAVFDLSAGAWVVEAVATYRSP
jgi:hypothetical protein